MDQNNDKKQPEKNENKKEDEGKLERLGRVIDPIAPKLDDQDLTDPGRMTPDAPPVDNRT